jgi:hypothetical protein
MHREYTFDGVTRHFFVITDHNYTLVIIGYTTSVFLMVFLTEVNIVSSNLLGSAPRFYVCHALGDGRVVIGRRVEQK